MANTKVTSHVIANNAISASMIQSAAVTDAKLHSTLDLSGKTLTLPATAIPSASTATTQAASDNSTKIATTAYVTTAIGNLVDSAPTALDTLNELAAALGDDASFSSTVTTSLAGKLSLSGGTMTGAIAAADFEVDASGDINLDAGGGDWRLKDDGTTIATISNISGDLQILLGQDKDYKFVIDDNGSQSTALLLDGSEAGFATFNSGGSFGGTGALKIPVGTTGQRPTAATGQIRYNSTDGALEVYNGSAWTAVGTGSSNKVLDTFTGNGSNRTFTLSVTPANEDAIMVFIDGAYQEKSDYVLTNNSLVLDTAPLNNEKIAVHIITASVHDGTSAVNQQFTATANQTDFTLSQDPKSENNTQVYINGVYQQKTDYTVTGTTLAFDTGLTVGDVVEVNMFTVATLGNTDTVTEGVSNQYFTDARARGAISVSGNAISYNSSTGVLTANFEEGPTFTNNVRVSGTLGIGANASNVIGVYSTKSFANGLAAELTNSESSTGSGLVVRGGNNASTYSADFRDYNSNSLMRVRGDGNVGIGETSPSAKLHIKKTAASTQHYDSYATAIIEDTEARLQLVATDGGSNAASLILSNEEKHWGLVNHGPSENNTFGIGYYASSSSGIDVADSLSSPFAITPGGYVGIGTNTPRYNLTVNGNNSTAIGIGVDNASGSSTLDIAALGTGYNNHGAAGGEVWFFSPDNINIGGATGQTNNIKFIANNNLNMVIKGDGSGIDMNQKTTVERTVNGSGSVSYEEILKVSRIGGATSNNQREAAISFFDAANSTYTAMITGVRTSPAGNYDGGLSIYTNSHSQNANASNISELVSGRVVDFGANQATTFYGDVYVSGANHRISQNGVTREAKGGYVAGNATVSYTVNHTNQSSFKVQAAMSHYGIMTSYGAAHEGIYGNGSGGLYSVLTTNHTSGASGSWSVTRVDTDNITVTKNAGTYNGGGYYYIIVEGANL